MATKEIPNQEANFGDGDFDRAFALQLEAPRRRRERMVARLALLLQNRGLLYRGAALGLIISTIVVFIIPVRYTSITRLMPPEQGAGAGMAAILSSISGKSGSGDSDLGVLSDFLGLKTSGDLFLGVLKSRIITIMVDDRNPQRAEAIAAEYVVQLDRVVTSLNNSSAHKESVFLEQ